MIHEDLGLLIEEAEEHMNKSLQHFQHELNHIRAGRATPAMVEDVRVDAYGSSMPLNQVATINATAPDLLVIQPWDKSTLNDIEKAIMSANLGFNPSNDGVLIRIPIPPLSEERRAELMKAAKSKGEDAKIAIRNIRRHSKDEIKKVQVAEKLPEDMRFEGEDQIQELTDKAIAKIDELLGKKETEIMTV